MLQLLSEITLCQGRRVTLVQRVYSYNGVRFIRDIVLFGQSVAVVPLLGEDVILAKQFRAPIGGWILEVPAGRVDPGEPPEETAKRELVEETGYYPKRLEKLGSFYMSPGYSDEVLHIYLAQELEFVGSKPEAGELIEVVKMKLDDAIMEILGSPIADAKTAISLLLLQYKMRHWRST